MVFYTIKLYFSLCNFTLHDTLFGFKNFEQMDKVEVIHLQKKISLYENILDCLNVKLFYLENRNSQNEFEDNNNKLEQIKTAHQVEIQKGKLAYLNSEFKIKFDILKEVENAG